ncbi:MAG: S8 family peptidase [Trueperaceae bacterium]
MKRLAFILLCFVLLVGLAACAREDMYIGATSLNVKPADVLTPSQPSSQLEIQNPTTQTVSWQVVIEQDFDNPTTGEWFLLDQTGGTLEAGASTIITVALSGNLSPGLYSATLTINEDSYVLLGQIPGTTTGDAGLSGTITTPNALIPITEEEFEPFAAAPLRTSSLEERYVPGQVLVKYKGDTATSFSQLNARQQNERQSLVQSVRADYSLKLLKAAPPGQADLLTTSEDAERVAQRLSQDPRVEYATPNYYLEALELPNDAEIAQQWALAAAGLPAAWEVPREVTNEDPIVVAILDTGFDLNHEDLRGRFLAGYDFCGLLVPITGEDAVCEQDANASYGTSSNNHGTHVSGILAAHTNNALGVVGAAYDSNIKLLPIKIFKDSGFGATIDSFSRGIRWAVGENVAGAPINENPAHIINLSVGGDFKVPETGEPNQDAINFMQDAVNAATEAGALIIAATGNNNQDYVLSPAAADNVLGVGSIDQNLGRSGFSNYSIQKRLGPGGVDVMAPGNGIISSVPVTPEDQDSPSYQMLSGTSMATPLVSGIAALLLSHEPTLGPEDLEARLSASSYFDPSFMNEQEYGKGILRADMMLGLPGPGSTVAIALGNNEGSSAFTTATLDGYGSTATFNLPNLAAGNYRFIALANGRGKQLSHTTSVNLGASEVKTLDFVLSPSAATP